MSEYVYRGLFWIVAVIIAVYCGVQRIKKLNPEKDNKMAKMIIISFIAVLSIIFTVMAVLSFMASA